MDDMGRCTEITELIQGKHYYELGDDMAKGKTTLRYTGVSARGFPTFYSKGRYHEVDNGTWRNKLHIKEDKK